MKRKYEIYFVDVVVNKVRFRIRGILFEKEMKKIKGTENS